MITCSQQLDCKRTGDQLVAADVWAGLVAGGAGGEWGGAGGGRGVSLCYSNI